MNETLYAKLGKERLDLLLSDFYDRVFANKILAPLFQNSKKEEIQQKQLLFISQFLGGPLDYTKSYGPPKMRQRHLAHKISPKAKTEWLKCMHGAIMAQDWDERTKEVFYGIFPPIAEHMVNSTDDN